MRALSAWSCAAALVFASLLPPSHIHLAGDDHDHAVEHSHWAPHGGASRTSFDDDDGRAIFVDHPGVLAAARVGMAPPTQLAAAILIIIETSAFARRANRLAGNAPRDGPHLDTDTPRGPPLVL